MKPILLGLLAICVGVACGGDDNDNNPAASETLAGSYDLLRLTPSGGSAISPPDASGIMTLTENRYSVVASYVTAGSADVIRVAQTGMYEKSGANLKSHGGQRRRHTIRPGCGRRKCDNHIDFGAGRGTGTNDYVDLYQGRLTGVIRTAGMGRGSGTGVGCDINAMRRVGVFPALKISDA